MNDYMILELLKSVANYLKTVEEYGFGDALQLPARFDGFNGDGYALLSMIHQNCK